MKDADERFIFCNFPFTIFGDEVSEGSGLVLSNRLIRVRTPGTSGGLICSGIFCTLNIVESRWKR